MKELDFNKLSNEIIEKLEKEQSIAFATCTNNIVAARTMCHVNIGLDILFSTDGKSGKVEQIKQNENVALVIGDLQIEAKAELLGHPSKHQLFIEKNDIKFPWMKDAFKPEPGKEDNGMLIICHPTKITIYKYLEGNPHWDVLLIEDKKSYRV